MKSNVKYHGLLTSPEPGISTRAAQVYETIGWDAGDATDIDRRNMAFLDDHDAIISVQCVWPGDKVMELCMEHDLNFISCMWRSAHYLTPKRYANIDISLHRRDSVSSITEIVGEMCGQLLEKIPDIGDITVVIRSMACDDGIDLDDMIALARSIEDLKKKDRRLEGVLIISSITSFEADLSHKYNDISISGIELLILADDRCIDGVKYDGLAVEVTDRRPFTDYVEEFFLKNPGFTHIYFYTNNTSKSPFIFNNSTYASQEDITISQEDQSR